MQSKESHELCVAERRPDAPCTVATVCPAARMHVNGDALTGGPGAICGNIVHAFEGSSSICGREEEFIALSSVGDYYDYYYYYCYYATTITISSVAFAIFG